MQYFTISFSAIGDFGENCYPQGALPNGGQNFTLKEFSYSKNVKFSYFSFIPEKMAIFVKSDNLETSGTMTLKSNKTSSDRSH